MSLFGFKKNSNPAPYYQQIGPTKDRANPNTTSPFALGALGVKGSSLWSTSKFKTMKDPIKGEPSLKTMQPTQPQKEEMIRATRAKAKKRAYKQWQRGATPALQEEGRVLFEKLVALEAKETFNHVPTAVDKSFADDFRDFLISHYKKGVETYQNAPSDDAPYLYKTRPLSSHKSVISFIDKHVDDRLRFEADLAKLILRYEKTGSLENATIAECWMYYKFIVRGMRPSDEDIAHYAAIAADGPAPAPAPVVAVVAPDAAVVVAPAPAPGPPAAEPFVPPRTTTRVIDDEQDDDSDNDEPPPRPEAMLVDNPPTDPEPEPVDVAIADAPVIEEVTVDVPDTQAQAQTQAQAETEEARQRSVEDEINRARAEAETRVRAEAEAELRATREAADAEVRRLTQERETDRARMQEEMENFRRSTQDAIDGLRSELERARLDQGRSKPAEIEASRAKEQASAYRTQADEQKARAADAHQAMLSAEQKRTEAVTVAEHQAAVLEAERAHARHEAEQRAIEREESQRRIESANAFAASLKAQLDAQMATAASLSAALQEAQQMAAHNASHAIEQYHARTTAEAALPAVAEQYYNTGAGHGHQVGHATATESGNLALQQTTERLSRVQEEAEVQKARADAEEHQRRRTEQHALELHRHYVSAVSQVESTEAERDQMEAQLRDAEAEVENVIDQVATIEQEADRERSVAQEEADHRVDLQAQYELLLERTNRLEERDDDHNADKIDWIKERRELRRELNDLRARAKKAVDTKNKSKNEMSRPAQRQQTPSTAAAAAAAPVPQNTPAIGKTKAGKTVKVRKPPTSPPQ